MIHDGLRFALRRRHKMVVALGASAALALSGLSIESASASTRSSLALSLSPDRSGAVRLDGSTVKGKIYVFVKNSREPRQGRLLPGRPLADEATRSNRHKPTF